MIASRRKAERLRDAMRMHGVDEARLARLVAPAGPDAGAKTPGEIALVAIVGVLALLRGRARAEAGTHTHSPSGDTTEAASQRPQARAVVPASASSVKFVNPVCGMVVETTAPKHVERYEGIAYYFCCDGCLTTFRQEPAKYAAIHRASMATVSA
jgi:xanthine dehydrogenase accessory factor